MAQTASETKFKPSCMEISIHGVIKAIEQIRSERGDFYANTIIIPAPDTLHKPTQIVIYSRMPMGAEESVVETVAHVRPTYRNSNGKWFFNCSLWNEKAAN